MKTGSYFIAALILTIWNFLSEYFGSRNWKLALLSCTDQYIALIVCYLVQLQYTLE
jgi:hypothetical protein